MSKKITFWNLRPRFAYSVYSFYGARATIKARYLLSRTFRPKKKLSRKSAPKLSVLGVKGAKILNTGFMTPKRHILARNHVFWRTLRENRCARLGCRGVEEPSPKKRKNSEDKRVQIIAHAQKRTPNPMCIKFCMVVDILDAITRTHFGYDRLRGFWAARGQISPIGFHRRPYNTLGSA